MLERNFVEQIVTAIKEKLSFPVEASGRHVHLCREDVELLFGPGYQLTPKKALSQPGQFSCEERLTVEGPKGSLEKVGIIGPARSRTQVEISMTDAKTLGIAAPLRLSGDTEGSPGCLLKNGGRSVLLKEGVIVAKRHIHMTPKDAERFKLHDGDTVAVKIPGGRPLILDDTVIRIAENNDSFMHIDYDEANAAGLTPKSRGFIIKRQGGEAHG